ncbi:hypothetical protein SynBIOSE41_03661 [Synechococcus sp. BIOS-E4-1]|nr:hypothetical protein SynBIOSE41_03661 [Synechococcus sp. BIOS-E4-1]
MLERCHSSIALALSCLVLSCLSVDAALALCRLTASLCEPNFSELLLRGFRRFDRLRFMH